MTKKQILSDLVMMITDSTGNTLAVSALNNKTQPTPLTKPGNYTLTLKVEKGNYVPYDEEGDKLVAWTPSHGKINGSGQGTEFEATLKITARRGKKTSFFISEGSKVLMVRFNNKPGSFTLCKVQVSLNKDNILEFTTVETLTGRAFVGGDKVAVPVLKDTPLEEFIAEMVEDMEIVDNLKDIGSYDLTLAADGLHKNAGIVTEITDKKATILTRGKNNKPVSASVVWKDDAYADKVLNSLGFGTALQFEALNEEKETPEVQGATLLLEVAEPAS